MNTRVLSLLNAYGGLLCAEHRYDDAEVIFRHALSIDENIPELNKNLGDCYYGLARYQEAVRYLRKAIALRNDYHRAYGSLGAVLRSVNKPDEALRIYNIALSFDMHNTYYKLSIAMCYLDLNALAKAEQLIVELVEANPSDMDIAKAHSIILNQKGELERSREILQQLLRTEKYRYSAFSSLSEHKDVEIPIGIIEEMEGDLSKSKNMSTSDKKLLCFGLWRVFDKKNQIDKAFNYLRRGNDLVFYGNKISIKNEIEFLKSQSQQQIILGEGINTFEDLRIQPIFIVGMPRSGSSLVEQILSAHTEISSAGETMILPRLVEKYKSQGSDSGSVDMLRGVRDEYLTALKEMTGLERGIVSDKTLSNFMNINLILAIFPHAKIIHIKREAMDNCFACYATDFKNGHFYTSDLRSLGEYYKAYVEYIDRETTDIRKESFKEVRYENIVMNMKSEITHILEFIGLEWQDNCMRFYENKNHVATASYYDVRKKVSNKSVNRWSRYAEYLNPLSEVLSDLGQSV